MNFLPSSANNSLVQTWKNEKKKKKEKEKKKKKKREKEKSWAGSKDNFVAKGRTRFLERGEVQGHHGGERGERSGQNRDYILNRNPPTREYLFRQLWQLRISTFVLPIRINSSLLFSFKVLDLSLHAYVFVLLVEDIIFDFEKILSRVLKFRI